MTQYLIRSMSTTDYAPQYKQEARPFHIYLLKPEERRSAFWSVYCGMVQQFDSIDDALAHGAAASVTNVTMSSR